MIDHVSVGVVDLAAATGFYTAVFAPLGIRHLVSRPGMEGFGKKYPEFWLNQRKDKELMLRDNGTHICLRTATVEAVQEFYRIAIELGASSSGEPGFRQQYHAPDYRDNAVKGYFAAFIKDVDQNHIEVVTFK